MGKLIDTDGLETVLTAANNTFLKKSGGTITGNVAFDRTSGGAINGMKIGAARGDQFNVIPTVNNNGQMNIGSTIDFHESDTSTEDWDVQLGIGNDGSNNYLGFRYPGETYLSPIAIRSSYAFTNLSGNTSTPAYFWAKNNSATLVIAGTTPSGQWAADTKSYTIPSGYRPPTTMYFPLAKTGSPQSMSYLQIGSDGAITIQNWGGTQSAVNFFCTATWTYMNP